MKNLLSPTGQGRTLSRFAALAALVLGSQAQAACDLSASPGSVQTCDSGTRGPLTLNTGDNTLIFPLQGTGSIQGSVTFGPGSDAVEMNSGSVSGSFNQGDDTDRFIIGAGSITGDVNQGQGRDDFVMTGGSLRSLAQGDGLDTFLMTGGIIRNAFEDGDQATMTGGTIGRVDMKLDDNIFTLSGGTILNNLVTGFGKDTVLVSGGSVGGAISVSGGDDRITVTGGEVRGEIRASFGNDTFNWSQAGTLRSAILLADGNDTANLAQLDERVLDATPLLDGGPGADTLTFDAVSTSMPARYANWETVNLNNASRMDLTGDLVLGDRTSTTGVLNADASSTVSSVSGSIRPLATGQRVTFNNAGTLDMSANNSANDTLTVVGNYAGNNARLLLQTVLGDDSSPSDKLVVVAGTLTGSTQINITNLGGTGAATQLNGIEVVQARDGAISEPTAFSQGNALSIGAYEYYLFKGGATAGSENSWYLRSAVLSPPLAVTPAPITPAVPQTPETPTTPATPQTPDIPTTPVVSPTSPSPADPAAPIPPVNIAPTAPIAIQPASIAPVAALGSPALPAPVAGAASIPLYRLEVPNYAVVTPAAAVLTRMSLGTFHDRQGEQSLLTETGWAPAGWTRTFGSDFKRSWSGTVEPTLEASLKGYQIGHDVYGAQNDSGQSQRVGLFVGHSRLDGDVQGFAGGFEDRRTGKLKLEGDSLGAYWTLTDRTGGYIDAVLMGTRLDGYSRSDRGVRIDTQGHALTLSLETGYPLRISSNWVIEPQAQLINQHIRLDSQNDGIADVSFDSHAWNSARLGARLKGRYNVQGIVLQPYLRGNLWRNFGGSDTVTFNQTTKISTRHRASSADLGAGLVAKISTDVSLYLGADYSTDLDNHDLSAISGNLGVRMSW